MGSQILILRTVTFAYPSSGAFVFDNLTLQFGPGWTGIVGPNGLGKTTLLRLIAGELSPVRGHIECSGTVAYCPQRTDDPPPGWGDFMGAADPAACAWRGRLQIDPDWRDRWPTLSHGQRKRAQVAMALWRPVHVLALDEPTNHIDQPGRQLILEALGGFHGVGLMVSHDRLLLDSLCHKTLCLDPTGPVLRPGNYSTALRQSQADRQERQAERNRLKHRLAGLEREISARSHAAARADRQRSKRGLNPKDHDAKGRIDLARVSGKDGQAGRQLRQLAGRHRHLQNALAGAFVPKQPRLLLRLPSQPCPGDRVLSLPQGSLALGPGLSLAYPDLLIQPKDRIGLTGPNGTGKTRLIERIVGQLAIPPDRCVYVPQEISEEQGIRICRQVRALPKEHLGVFMTVISTLGSDPQRLLETDSPSPGELRKLLLASGVVSWPYLIVMDEPTNHLDLPSIQALETALASCECAMVLVSHDPVFLKALVRTHWAIQEAESPTGGRRQPWVLNIRPWDGYDRTA
ncbi:MAG: ABC-F family ATP-binding cassette domain-containing protein [Phycisphaerae bacterium]|nr:ABC-F family ATP-binding cassette domain-containing protein [Phycisphaerae bacterium]